MKVMTVDVAEMLQVIEKGKVALNPVSTVLTNRLDKVILSSLLSEPTDLKVKSKNAGVTLTSHYDIATEKLRISVLKSTNLGFNSNTVWAINHVISEASLKYVSLPIPNMLAAPDTIVQGSYFVVEGSIDLTVHFSVKIFHEDGNVKTKISQWTSKPG